MHSNICQNSRKNGQLNMENDVYIYNDDKLCILQLIKWLRIILIKPSMANRIIIRNDHRIKCSQKDQLKELMLKSYIETL